MKNAQNEFEKSTEKSLSAYNTTTNTANEQQTSTSSVPVESTTNPIELSIENSENVQQNNNNINATAADSAAAAETSSTTTAHAPKMTEEHDNKKHEHSSSSSSNSVNNNNNNINNSSPNSNSIIAEAAKILLKNGINGTSAAAAALFNSFQLPAAFPSSSTESLLEPPPAHVASTSKMSTAISTATIAIGHHSPQHQHHQQHQRNNGLPSPSSHFKGNVKDAFNIQGAHQQQSSSGGGNLIRKPLTTLDAGGVIDCSFGGGATLSANGAHKKKSSTMATGYSIGNTHSGSGGGCGGGRLQFFKDGKFILELARSKDGERGGWVSVPRKQFRTPSATSSTVTPASTANTCIYPKIESSTSFSFSDDNSSIQSSPWQRDHCWKQATPKRNISKEMNVYYQLPKGITLTNEGLRIAKLKRRRPFDNTKYDIKINKIFEIDVYLKSQQQQKHQEQIQNGKAVKTDNDDDEDHYSNSSSVATLTGVENDDNIRVNDAKNDDDKNKTSASSTISIKDEIKENSDDKITTEMRKDDEETTTTKTSIDDNDDKMDETTCNSVIEKMNTSEEDVEIDNQQSQQSQQKQQITVSEIDNKTDLSPKVNDIVEDIVVDAIAVEGNSLKQQETQKSTTPVKSKTGVEDKRLIKKKTIVRAKLTTIVQKLIDQMPTRVSNLLKTPTLNSTVGIQQQHNTNTLSNKVSPTSSSSTSPSLTSASVSTVASSSTTVGTASSHRLVEYHQQHVSPRKRILREFEKVSLDDSVGTVTGAGGKRSRAKSSAASSTAINTTNYRNARSPNNRIHSSVCNVPTASSLSTTTAASMLSSSSASSTNGGSESHFGTKHSKNVTATVTGSVAASTNVPPTRLYSSYSIHSLLADNASTSSGNGSSSNNKKSLDYSVASSYHQHHQPQSEHLQITPNMRKSISPKSPEAGGKSPSNAAHKKRSPPYASPLREAHSRSPTVGNNFDRSPRATPPDYKQRYGAPGLTEHHLHHRQQQQQQGAFYSPYMMSSKYVPGSSGSSGLATTSGALSPPISTNNSRSPRHSANAFTSCPTTPTNASASATTTSTLHNIPNSHLTMSHHHHRDNSPTRSLAESPRDTNTPRTVPKKTASIRRQFASPTSSSSSSHSHNTTNSSCPSPGGGGGGNDESAIHMDNKNSSSSASTNAAIAYQQMLQRQSSSAAALASPLHAAAYYMYPPTAASLSPFGNNGANSNTSGGGASGVASSNSAAATSPYIPTLMPPSYYHSYISALNITKHYYMGAGASPQTAAAAAAARLTPPFHHLGIPYNGVNAAAMAAMAAAFSTGQPNHLGHHSMLPPPPTAALYGSGGGGGVIGGLSGLGSLGSSSLSSSGTNTTLSSSSSSSSSSLLHKSNENNLTAFTDGTSSSSMFNNSSQSGEALTSSMRSNITQAIPHSHNIKDEQSSDVPLNLSKH